MLFYYESVQWWLDLFPSNFLQNITRCFGTFHFQERDMYLHLQLFSSVWNIVKHPLFTLIWPLCCYWKLLITEHFFFYQNIWQKNQSFCLIKSMQEHAAWTISRVMIGRRWDLANCRLLRYGWCAHRVSFVSFIYHAHRRPFRSAEWFTESQRSRQGL